MKLLAGWSRTGWDLFTPPAVLGFFIPPLDGFMYTPLAMEDIGSGIHTLNFGGGQILLSTPIYISQNQIRKNPDGDTF